MPELIAAAVRGAKQRPFVGVDHSRAFSGLVKMLICHMGHRVRSKNLNDVGEVGKTALRKTLLATVG